jgi:hypothetical protein
MRFAGIDVAAERHVAAMVDETGRVLCKPNVFGENAEGYAHLFQLLTLCVSLDDQRFRFQSPITLVCRLSGCRGDHPRRQSFRVSLRRSLLCT